MKQLLTIFILLFITSFSYGQGYSVTSYGVRNGLASDNIEDIVQDEKGYLWVANGFALSRFDGSKFENFKSPEDYGNVVGNITGLKVRKDGNLQFLAMRGKVIFDMVTKMFIYVKTDSIAIRKCAENGEDVGVAPMGTEDDAGNVWYNGGADFYVLKEKGTELVKVDKLKVYDRVTEFVDNKETYCLLKNNFLYRYNGKTFDRFDLGEEANINHLYVDKKNRFWMFDGNYFRNNDPALKSANMASLFMFDPSENTIKNIDLSLYGKPSGGIIEDDNGNLWLGCENAVIAINANAVVPGALIPNIKGMKKGRSGKIVFYNDNSCYELEKDMLQDITPKDALGNAVSIKSLIIDKEENIWIATSNGLFKCSPSIAKLNTFKLSSEDKNNFSKEKGSQIEFVDSKDRVWFSSPKTGDATNDLKNLFVMSADQKIRPLKMFDAVPKVAFAEYKSNIWINDGNNIWEYKDDKFTKVYSSFVKTDNSEIGFYTDKKDRLWCSFSRNEYLLVDNEFIQPLKLDVESFNPALFAEDGKNNLFVLSIDKIFMYDENKKQFVLKHTIKNKDVASDFYSMSVDKYEHFWLYDYKDRLVVVGDGFEQEKKLKDIGIVADYNATGNVMIARTVSDKNGNIWIYSFSSGIFYIVPNEKTCVETKRFSVKDGLSANSDDFLGFDKEGNMWAASKLGLDKINGMEVDKNFSFVVNHYSEKDGIRIKTNYNYFVANKPKLAEFYITDYFSGYCKVDIDAKVLNAFEPITSIGYVSWLTSDNNDMSLHTYYYTKQDTTIELPYKFNPLEINFIGICLTDGDKVKYKYMLEGLDDNWNEQKGTNVKYTSLAPGKYVFKLIACNNDGVWNKIPVAFSFSVMAPWYRSAIAYFGYFIGFFIILFGFNNVRTRQLKLRQNELEKMVKERTEEILFQKEIIEEKNKDIMDSIHYAKRIQRSLLPTEKYIDKSLKRLKKDK